MNLALPMWKDYLKLFFLKIKLPLKLPELVFT